jgi:hypothetical protein
MQDWESGRHRIMMMGLAGLLTVISFRPEIVSSVLRVAGHRIDRAAVAAAAPQRCPVVAQSVPGLRVLSRVPVAVVCDSGRP